MATSAGARSVARATLSQQNADPDEELLSALRSLENVVSDAVQSKNSRLLAVQRAFRPVVDLYIARVETQEDDDAGDEDEAEDTANTESLPPFAI